LVTQFENRKITIPPNSVEIHELWIGPRKNNWSNSAKPVQLKFEISYDHEMYKKIKIPYQYNLKPLKKQWIKNEPNHVVDGDVQEWQNLNYVKDDPESEFKIEWGMAYDNDHIYIGGKVNDSDVQIDSSKNYGEQDFIAFQINLNHHSKSLTSSRPTQTLILTPKYNDIPQRIYRGNSIPENWKYESISSEDGYQFEVKIPIDKLIESQGDPWENIKVNIFTGDIDKDNPDGKRHWYSPAWNSNQNFLGAAMYYRN
jgi:hypothetical protein